MSKSFVLKFLSLTVAIIVSFVSLYIAIFPFRSRVPETIITNYPVSLPGDDQITGDVILGESGNDTIDGGSENDLITDDQDDRLSPATGKSRIVFSAPSSMLEDETLEAELVLSRNLTLDQLPGVMSSPLDGDARIGIKGEIQTTDEIVAEVTSASDAIIVKSITPQRQALARDPRRFNRWRWTLTGVKPGNWTLYITVFSLISTPTGVSNTEIESFNREVTVKVIPVPIHTRAAKFFLSNYQWLLTALILPVIFFVLQDRSKQKKRPRKPKRNK